MYTLYSMQRSGNCYKVRLAFAKLGIPYRLVEVDILKGETRTPEFLAKNPSGHVPLLEVAPGRYLPESAAILWYVAGGTALAPDDRIDRAETLQWMFFEQHSVEPNLGAAHFWLTLVKGGRELQTLSGPEVQAYRRTVGFIFQDFRLVPRFTVFQNVSFVMRVLGVGEAVQQRKTFQVLKWVGLQHRMNAFPEELSGGEQQRIAIARALVNDPQLILADEPTGNLDPDLSLEIMNLFREINARGTTVVVATHDRELIRRVGRRAVTLDHGHVVEVTA